MHRRHFRTPPEAGIRAAALCRFAATICFLAFSFACTASYAAEGKRVMLLHSFGRDFRPWNEYARTIRAELERQSRWPLDIIDHTLVSARFTDDGTDHAFMEYLRALHQRQPFDLIVSLGAPASFVQRRSMGMGLSICKSIVEQHGGKLTAVSIQPRGALLTDQGGNVLLTVSDTGPGARDALKMVIELTIALPGVKSADV